MYQSDSASAVSVSNQVRKSIATSTGIRLGSFSRLALFVGDVVNLLERPCDALARAQVCGHDVEAAGSAALAAQPPTSRDTPGTCRPCPARRPASARPLPLPTAVITAAPTVALEPANMRARWSHALDRITDGRGRCAQPALTTACQLRSRCL